MSSTTQHKEKLYIGSCYKNQDLTIQASTQSYGWTATDPPMR